MSRLSDVSKASRLTLFLRANRLDLPAEVSKRLALPRALNSSRKVQTPDGAFGAEKQPKPLLT